ncbi:MAG: hypothetical protein Q9160_008054 [Pyrenula sp. 1 TL-2023]
MLLHAFRFRRLLLGLLLSILTVRFLYKLSSSSNESDGRESSLDPNRIIKELQELTYSKPQLQQLDLSTLPHEGRHAELLARFISLYITDPKLSLWQTLTSALRLRYPWIRLPSTRAYTPFVAPAAQMAGPAAVATTLGITIVVSARDFLFTLQLISTLRNTLQCKLPIEIAYLGSGPHELSLGKRDALSSLAENVFLNDLVGHFSDDLLQMGASEVISNHALKSYAVLASRFSSVLLVDPDVIFLRNPESLLEVHPAFQNTGTLYYHSRAWKPDSGSKSLETRDWIDENLLAARVPSSDLQQSLYWTRELAGMMDDSVIALNKSIPAVWATVVLSAQMHMPGVREELHEHLGVDGITETWWIAAEMAGMKYGFQEGYAGCIGRLEGSLHQRQMCSAHALHMDERGLKPLWFSGGLVRNKAIGGAAGVVGTKPEMFEFYMVPGVRAEDWDEQPRWLHAGDEVWCAEGRPIIPIKVNGLDGIIGQLIEEAKNVSEKYRDV